MAYVERAKFRGRNVLVLRKVKDGKFFAFGIARAKLIVEAIDDIREFVIENDPYWVEKNKEKEK